MDPGIQVYHDLITNVLKVLQKVEPKLCVLGMQQAAKTLDTNKIPYKLEGKLISITDGSDKHYKILFGVVLELVEKYEQRYGYNEIWLMLKVPVVKTLMAHREAIKKTGLELPVGRFQIDYVILETLFGFKGADFRSRKWFNDIVLVTNKKIVFPKNGSWENITYTQIATIGRQIYVGYSGHAAKGVIRAIDYVAGRAGMSCVIVEAKKDMMADFLKIATVMRAEYRRLNELEAKVLVALYDGTMVENLPQKCGISHDEARQVAQKLLDLKYADEKGHITSYGLNAAIQSIKK